MSFCGRYPLGETVPLAFLSQNASGVPSLPDAVPSILIYSDSGAMKKGFVPAYDRYSVTGLFLLPLFLDADFAQGRYHAVMDYAISGNAYRAQHDFEVLGCGDSGGRVLALGMMELPSAGYALPYTERGIIKKLRNPRSV